MHFPFKIVLSVFIISFADSASAQFKTLRNPFLAYEDITYLDMKEEKVLCVEKYSYKVSKRGRIKKDSILLFRKTIDTAAHTMFGVEISYEGKKRSKKEADTSYYGRDGKLLSAVKIVYRYYSYDNDTDRMSTQVSYNSNGDIAAKIIYVNNGMFLIRDKKPKWYSYRDTLLHKYVYDDAFRKIRIVQQKGSKKRDFLLDRFEYNSMGMLSELKHDGGGDYDYLK